MKKIRTYFRFIKKEIKKKFKILRLKLKKLSPQYKRHENSYIIENFKKYENSYKQALYIDFTYKYEVLDQPDFLTNAL